MKVVLRLFILIFSFYSSYGQSLKSKIDSMLTSVYPNNGPGISILIAKNGKTVYKKAFGKSNLELNTVMTPNNVFQIGSITKQFTAVSILMLQEQGKLKIEDEITKYIPDYPTNGKIITIYHLLNHTSGIKGRTPVGNPKVVREDKTAVELIDYFKNLPANFDPGEQFRYSNSGYIILGRIIEIVSGQSYEDFIEKNIFDKLGMTSSFYGSNKEIITNRASGYQHQNDKYVNSDYMSLTLPYSAGSILSNTDDLLKWQNAINANTLIDSISLKKAISPSTLNNGKKIPYGYGWRIGYLNGSPVIAHHGSTLGYSSSAIYLPKENVYVVSLTNCNCKNIFKTSEINAKIAAIAIGKPITKTSSKAKKEIVVDSKILRQYIGEYELGTNLIINITYEDSAIYILAPNQSKSVKLFAKQENYFFVKVSEAEITFNANTEGEIISLTLNTGTGRQLIAKKIK